MNTLAYILDKYNFDNTARPPFKINGRRWEDLPLLLNELGLVHGVELGVEQGKYSERLCQLIPDIKLYSIDAWTAYASYREHVSQDKIDGFYRSTIERLAPYNVDVIKAFSMDAVELFGDGSLDFVYIDGNHEFVSVTQDIAHWSKKVRKGGIVAGHDFVRDKNRKYVNHVKDVVHAWTYSHGIRPWFVLSGDKSPSWFWVVE